MGVIEDHYAAKEAVLLARVAARGCRYYWSWRKCVTHGWVRRTVGGACLSCLAARKGTERLARLAAGMAPDPDRVEVDGRLKGLAVGEDARVLPGELVRMRAAAKSASMALGRRHRFLMVGGVMHVRRVA